MKIKWIGQSGYILSTENTEIIIDPYLSDIVNKVAKRPRMVSAPIKAEDINSDAVVCTHNHLDHLDPGAVIEMDKDLLFITTNEGRDRLFELGRKNVKVINQGESINIGDFKLTAVFAHHTVEAFGLIVEADGVKLYFSGDTLYDEKLFEIEKYHPDFTFICINGKLGNMNVEEAIITAKKIGAKVNVPNHYGMFISNTENPKLFTDNINGGFEMEFNYLYDITELN